jgi:DNA-binding response OmpR family regulator
VKRPTWPPPMGVNAVIGARVLVIDDSPDITNAISIGLKGYGISVDAYVDPVEAVSAFKAGSYDLAILDVRMPRMNGFQVYRELKKIDEDLRICFLTAFEIHESEFRKLFPEMTAQLFLRKPITMRALRSKINEMVNLDPKNIVMYFRDR